MGFISWNCKACGHPIISHYAVDERTHWMTHAVAQGVGETGETMTGLYDGYGRLYGPESGEAPVDIFHRDERGMPQASVYHEECFLLAGSPEPDGRLSEWAMDQGYFFDPATMPDRPGPREFDLAHSAPAKVPRCESPHATFRLIEATLLAQPRPPLDAYLKEVASRLGVDSRSA